MYEDKDITDKEIHARRSDEQLDIQKRLSQF